MNIGSNLSRKISGTSAVAAFASIVATTALAGPNQLDILGLIPGESKLSQVKQASVDPNSKSDKKVRLEIGGHKMPCLMSFRNGKLDSLLCATGKGPGEYAQYTKASNTEVHSDLTAGFTKKFGKPDSVDRRVVRTRIGVEYAQQFVTWKDKLGNMLQLISMVDTVDAGAITFDSSEYLKEEAEKSAAQEARKKF